MRKRRSFGKFLADVGRYFRAGLEKPLSMISARFNVGVWSVILLSTLAAITRGVINENWMALWINAGFGLFQGAALRWSLHGLMYRKEIKAKQAEVAKFIEVVQGGYAVNNQQRKEAPDGNGN